MLRQRHVIKVDLRCTSRSDSTELAEQFLLCSGLASTPKHPDMTGCFCLGWKASTKKKHIFISNNIFDIEMSTVNSR